MRKLPVIAAALAIVFVQAGTANAAKRKLHPTTLATRTVIQPTRTIIHNPDGTTTIIVTPKRSYLDPGTEVLPGEEKSTDYAFPPSGDPGRPNWWYGPDQTGGAFYIVRQPYELPGINPDTP
jgi:hypothetical protein